MGGMGGVPAVSDGGCIMEQIVTNQTKEALLCRVLGHIIREGSWVCKRCGQDTFWEEYWAMGAQKWWEAPSAATEKREAPASPDQAE